MTNLRTDKEMGNFWAWFWLIDFWGAREVLGLRGDRGSEQECSQPPAHHWNPVNKSPFLSTQIFGSCIKATSSQILLQGRVE